MPNATVEHEFKNGGYLARLQSWPKPILDRDGNPRVKASTEAPEKPADPDADKPKDDAPTPEQDADEVTETDEAGEPVKVRKGRERAPR